MSKTNENRISCCSMLNSFIFIMWDGLGFFGFDDVKLNRLRGIPPKWYDRFRNKRWILYNITVVVLVIYLFASQLGKIGDV